MLCATLGLLGAPVLRLILLTGKLEFPTAIIVGAVAADLFFLPCFAYDLLTRGSIHRAHRYAFALFVVSQIVMMMLPSWPAWIRFSQAVQHFLS
jgi:hypothetical protein